MVYCPKSVELSRQSSRLARGNVVQEAWLSTLQLTRYAEDDWHGLDGTTLEFCRGDLFGYTWSPETGLPAMLADLGRKLGALARSNEKDREPLLVEAESLARRIAKEAEAEQIELFGKKMSRLGRRINARGATEPFRGATPDPIAKRHSIGDGTGRKTGVIPIGNRGVAGRFFDSFPLGGVLRQRKAGRNSPPEGGTPNVKISPLVSAMR